MKSIGVPMRSAKQQLANIGWTALIFFSNITGYKDQLRRWSKERFGKEKREIKVL